MIISILRPYKSANLGMKKLETRKPTKYAEPIKPIVLLLTHVKFACITQLSNDVLLSVLTLCCIEELSQKSSDVHGYQELLIKHSKVGYSSR